MTSAKSLTKTAVLDASDKPEDQDEARKRRVKMDFASWRKQTKAGKTTHQEEVGISSAAEMKKAQKEAELRKKEQDAVRKEKEALKKEEVQVDEVYKKLPVAKMAKKISDKSFKSGQSGVSTKSAEQTGKMIGVLDTHDPQRSKAKSKIKEAKVDIGKSADEKATARNQRNNPKKGDKGFRKFATSAFIRRKEGQSLAWGKDSAASELRRDAHAKKRGVKEETIDELNRYGKETGKATGSLNKRPGSPVKTGGDAPGALRNVRGMIRKETGKPEGQQKKVRGAKPPTSGYGAPSTPVDKIKKYLDAKRAAKADPSQGRYPPGSRKD